VQPADLLAREPAPRVLFLCMRAEGVRLVKPASLTVPRLGKRDNERCQKEQPQRGYILWLPMWVLVS
jgi:hypothetical protein